MATVPGYAAVPRQKDIGVLSVANTSRDGTGTLVTLSTGDTGGDVIEQVIIQAISNTTPGMIRFFLSEDGGSTKHLVDEVLVAGGSPGGAIQAFRITAPDLVGMMLFTTNEILYAATNNAETFNVIVQKSGL